METETDVKLGVPSADGAAGERRPEAKEAETFSVKFFR